MFHRIIVEEWQRILSAIGILLFFFVFVSIVIRTYRMPRQKVHRLASMPLNDAQDSHEQKS
jgi:cbb3-type cytochrome oxidase subunit 3